MSVRYKKFQNKLKDSKTYDKWYGRAVTLGTVTTANLAEEISHSTTVTRADIMAVLIELAEAMRRHMLNSQSVQLDGIGTFRVGINSVPADTEAEFKANNIKNFRIIYTAGRAAVASYLGNDGKSKKVYVKNLLNGATAEELPSDKSAASPSTGSEISGDTGTDTGGNA